MRIEKYSKNLSISRDTEKTASNSNTSNDITGGIQLPRNGQWRSKGRSEFAEWFEDRASAFRRCLECWDAKNLSKINDYSQTKQRESSFIVEIINFFTILHEVAQ